MKIYCAKRYSSDNEYLDSLIGKDIWVAVHIGPDEESPLRDPDDEYYDEEDYDYTATYYIRLLDKQGQSYIYNLIGPDFIKQPDFYCSSIDDLHWQIDPEYKCSNIQVAKEDGAPEIMTHEELVELVREKLA